LKLFLFLFLLFSIIANADEVFLGYGLGVFNNSDTRVVNLGYREDIWQGIYWQNKLGFWSDGSGDPNRGSSLYASSGPGLLIDLDPIEIRNGIGLAIISSPDSYLGGIFPEFNENLYVGLRDKRGNGIGVEYEHLSNAGIYSQNMGRDFLEIQLSQRW
jgi:Lipid A 3-O-deacylase (PagL)